MCISPSCKSSKTKTLHEETRSNFGGAEVSKPSESHQSEPDVVEGLSAPVEESLCDHEEVVVFETLLVPLVEVEMVQLAPPVESDCKALDKIPEEEGTCLVAPECSGGIVGPSPPSFFWSDGPKVIHCSQVVSKGGDAVSFLSWPSASTLADFFAAPEQKKLHQSRKKISAARVELKVNGVCCRGVAW